MKLKDFIALSCNRLPGFNCSKQTVMAMITTKSGEYSAFGINNIANAFPVCPRDTAEFISGQGYHLCAEECNNDLPHKHAEIDAIERAQAIGLDLHGATLTLVGHTYCCDNCTNEMKKVGISSVVILSENNFASILL